MTSHAQTHVAEKRTSTAEPYAPLPQFKLIDAPPLLQDISSENTEFWLVRIQDSQLGPDDLNEKRIKVNLKTPNDKLGSFEGPKGTQFEVLDLHRVGGVQPVVFIPDSNGAPLAVRKVSRQISIVRRFDPIILSDPPHNDGEISAQAHERPAQNKCAESLAVSGSIGGFSTAESLQEDEERISTKILKKSGKRKHRRDHQTRSSPPLKSFQECSKASFVEREDEISKENVTKSNKIENLQEKVSTENVQKSTSEPVSSMVKASQIVSEVCTNENKEKVVTEDPMKSGKNLKHESMSEPEFSSPRPLQKQSESDEGKLTENSKKSNKRSKSEQWTSYPESSPLRPSGNESGVDVKESVLSSKKSHKKHSKSKNQNQ